MKPTKVLAAIVVLQILIMVGLWYGGPAASPAYGQIPDAAAQRARMIEELKAMNEKMDKLTELLNSGKLQVRVAPPDEKAK